jgi:hypothetical protein
MEVLPFAASDDPQSFVRQRAPQRRTCAASSAGASSHSRSHRVSSFRGLPQKVAAPNAELSRLRLAKPPPSKSGSLARTCGDGKVPACLAPQVVQSLSPRLNHDLAAVLLLAVWGHCQSKIYTACLRLREGQSSAVFAHESPTRSGGFGVENGLYLFALTVPPTGLSNFGECRRLTLKGFVKRPGITNYRRCAGCAGDSVGWFCERRIA